MTPAQMKAQIEHTAEAARAEGQIVEVHNLLPSVFIEINEDCIYYFQEHKADRILDEAKAMADAYEVDIEDALLHMAQGW